MKLHRTMTAALLTAALLTSALAVGPIPAEAVEVPVDQAPVFEPLAASEPGNGTDGLLVSELDYHVPGMIRAWTHDDCGARLRSDRSSATLTVTEAPADGAEVWKIKLLVNTGLCPEPGRAYRFRAELESSAAADYEICYNEGELEKGYDVLYGQRLQEGVQTVERTIYVSDDRTEPGELVVQFSLGLLPVGASVTIRKVELEAADAAFVSVLPEAYAFDGARTVDDRTYGIGQTPGTQPLALDALDWGGQAVASKSGDRVGDLRARGGEAELTITGGTEPWDARFNIDTGARLAPETVYRVIFRLETERDYSNFEIKFGSGFLNDFDIREDYGALKGLSLAEGEAREVVWQFRTGAETGGLLIQMFAGATAGRENTVRVSALELQKLVEGEPEPETVTVTYPTGGATDTGSFEVRDGKGRLTGDGSSAVFTHDKDATDEYWQRGLFINGVCTLNAGVEYVVSFDVSAERETAFEVAYNRDGNWGEGHEKGFGGEYGLTATETASTVRHTVTPEEGGELSLRVDLGKAAPGVAVTVCNLRVETTGAVASEAELSYPDADAGTNGSFEVRDGKGTLSGDGSSAVYTHDEEPTDEYWQRGLFVNNLCTLETGVEYVVSFVIGADRETAFEVAYNRDGNWGEGHEKGFGGEYGLTASETVATVSHTVTPEADGALSLRVDLGKAAPGAVVTVRDVRVEKANANTDAPTVTVSYPNSAPTAPGSFEVRDGKGTLGGDGSSAVYVHDGEPTDEYWQRGLFINGVCTLNAGVEYVVSFDVSAECETAFEVAYNRDGNWGEGHEKGFGGEYGLTASETASTVRHTVTPEVSGELSLRIDLGRAEPGVAVTVRNLRVERIAFVESGEVAYTVSSFGSVWSEQNGYETALTRLEDRAIFTVTPKEGVERTDWRAKLLIDTGFVPARGRSYSVSFDVEGTEAQRVFHVLYGYGGSGEHEKSYGERWNESLAAGRTRTVTQTIQNSGGTGSLTLELLLGLIDGAENSFTVSNVRVYEMRSVTVQTGGSVREEPRVTLDMQPDYEAELTRAAEAATVEVGKAPAEGAEFWKLKLFADTGVTAEAGAMYRVTADVTAEQDTDFEICYNRDGEEKGFDALYALHAAAGETKTVEKVFCAGADGNLVVQLSLGMAAAGSRVRLSKLRVERIDFRYSGTSAFPGGMDYSTSGAVSFWAHEDYAAAVAGAEDAVTVRLLETPAVGAEPWKVKLFLGTGAVLQPGRHYRVTAEILGRNGQDFEICYNSGDREMGYGAEGGLRLTPGKLQTVEKLITVPAELTDAADLRLQFNLGAASGPNTVTVCGVTVEEISFRYTELVGESFAYRVGPVYVQTAPQCFARLETAADSATIHLTHATADAQAWMARLMLRTGAQLAPGRNYRIRAELLSAKELDYELCFNNGYEEKGFGALYGQHLSAGAATAVEYLLHADRAGELVLQFSVGSPEPNDVTVRGLMVQELSYTASEPTVPSVAVTVRADGAELPTPTDGTLALPLDSGEHTLQVGGAQLCATDRYAVSFTARADGAAEGSFLLRKTGGIGAILEEPLRLTAEAQTFTFLTEAPLAESGSYELLWQLHTAGAAEAVIGEIRVRALDARVEVFQGSQRFLVNGEEAAPAVYNIDGYNYVRLRDLALLLNQTEAHFSVRYNGALNSVALSTGMEYIPVGGELNRDADASASCRRSLQPITVNGNRVTLKAFNLGGNNYFRLRDLADVIGFTLSYDAAARTVLIQSPKTA